MLRVSDLPHSDKIKYLNAEDATVAHVVSIREEVVPTRPKAKWRQQRKRGAAPASRKWPRRARPERAGCSRRGQEARGRGKEVSLGRGKRKSRWPGAVARFLVVGLGNPGLEYLWTPHNAGFMAIDRIAQQEGVVVAEPALPGHDRNLPYRRARSGPGQAGDVYESERRSQWPLWFSEFEADPAQDLLVIYDELDLALGTFKIRERGSPAGHNGARSVTSALGSQEWLRLRIGRWAQLAPRSKRSAGGKRPGRDYLLSPMRKADLTVLDEVLDQVAVATRRILQDGPGPAMNEFNRKDKD